jgi:Ca2+-binding RTX toxin-like protein
MLTRWRIALVTVVAAASVTVGGGVAHAGTPQIWFDERDLHVDALPGQENRLVVWRQLEGGVFTNVYNVLDRFPLTFTDPSCWFHDTEHKWVKCLRPSFGRFVVKAGDLDDHVEVSGPANVFGGTGNDRLRTGNLGTFRVFVFGEDGNDTFYSGRTSDHFSGGTGTDTVDYAGRPESITASLATNTGGAPTLGESDSYDTVENLSGGAGPDRLTGDDQANVLSGWFGDDTIAGRDGDDLLLGGDGADIIFGDLGLDWLVGDAGFDRLDGGGAGVDYCIPGADGASMSRCIGPFTTVRRSRA